MRSKYSVAILMCLCLLTGYTSNPTPVPTPSKPQLTVYYWPSDFQGGDISGLILRYQAAHPGVNVKLESISWDGEAYISRLQTELLSGEGPDVILFNTRATMPNIAKLVDAGVFEDLNPYLTADPTYDPDNFVQPVIRSGEVGDKQLFMPYQYAIPVFAADKTTLVDAGLGQLPQLNQDDLISTAAAYTSRTDQIVFPADDIGVFPYNDAVYMLIASSGLQLYDLGEKKLTISHADLVHLLTNYAAYHTASEPDDYYDSWGSHIEDYPYNLESGFMRKDFLLYDITEQYGDDTFPLEFQLFTAQEGDMATEYFPYPPLDASSGLTAVPTAFVALNTNSANKQASYDFIRTTMSYAGRLWYFPIDRTIQKTVTSDLTTGRIQNIMYYDVRLTPAPFTADNIASYSNMLGRVTSAVAYDRNIMQIVCTAFEDFASGEISSADQAADQIAQQVGFYLSE